MIWLMCYALEIGGCVALFGVILQALMDRRDEVRTETLVTAAGIPLVMVVLYLVCWTLVLCLWKMLRRRETRVFVCAE